MHSSTNTEAGLIKTGNAKIYLQSLNYTVLGEAHRVPLPPRMCLLRLALVWMYLYFTPSLCVHTPSVPPATFSRYIVEEKATKGRRGVCVTIMETWLKRFENKRRIASTPCNDLGLIVCEVIACKICQFNISGE